jgi:hypothetical protein
MSFSLCLCSAVMDRVAPRPEEKKVVAPYRLFMAVWELVWIASKVDERRWCTGG